ncbi:MAG: ABC transporter ATP-binding protein [Porphyromonadaceae bacterium]|nr:ABC transporter ATP-binding protein [Porphyromonadaceae bacterium]
MDSTPVLEGCQVTIGYREGKRENALFPPMDFALYPGELTALLGINGVGKSTLLRTLSATQPALGGEIRLKGKNLSAYKEGELARHISVVLTERQVAGGLRVHELVALGRYPYTGFWGSLRPDDRRIIEKVMEETGIAHKRNFHLSQLSDGERQKAFIAKTLAQESEVILLDEPTAFLDLPSRIEMMSLLHRLAAENGKTILLSTHDVGQALVLADKLWLLSPQKGLECGVTEELILAGRLDNLFPSNAIRFDPEHGSYYPLVQGHSRIALSAANPTLLHWGVNLLNRNGFSCLLDENMGDTAEGKSPSVPTETARIAIEAADHIAFSYAGEKICLSSFSALITTLRSRFGKDSQQ